MASHLFTASTNGSGYYSFGGLAAGSYTITPTAINYTFLPTSRNVNLNGDNATDQDFTAAYNAIPDVSDLRGLVLAANLSNTRLQNSLLAPLEATLSRFDGDYPHKVQYACSSLSRFIAVVRQNIAAGILPAATGNPWIDAANDIRALSGCPTR